ncbi:MAG TPA: PilZ domain-containing protein [Candidatus Dormibacteraeota bacterium]|nr:PilZ domain-containing protein [Candidatus Dormibacteraeota bacterium]
MENIPKSTLDMHTLLLCNDVPYLGVTRNVLAKLHVTPKMVNTSAAALAMIQAHEFDVIVVDWREIDSLADFLSAVRGSKVNQDCVLVAIVRDLLDLRQAFAAGVHFLIHKPASAVQIERCLRAAYSARVVRRRKHHREPVETLASVSTRTQPFGEAMLINLSEGGAKLRTSVQDFVAGVSLSAADDVNLRFALPGTADMLEIAGTVIWVTADACGVRFRYIPEAQRTLLQQWLTECVERSISRTCERLRAACA